MGNGLPDILLFISLSLSGRQPYTRRCSLVTKHSKAKVKPKLHSHLSVDCKTETLPAFGFKQAVMWWLLLFVPVCQSSLTNKFDLITSDDPVSGWRGSSVILPCILTPALKDSLEVRWHRPNNYTTPVLLYQKQQIQQGPVDPRYQGRVSLIGELDKGNLSLSIKNLTLADSGEFICFVSAVNQGYKDAIVHLIVTVRGSPPVLSLADGGGGQVNITCVSEGWSPEPTLTWRNREGTEIRSKGKYSTTDAHGFVRVTSWLLSLPSESEWLSCSVGLSEEERKESRILPHFSHTYAGLWKDIIMGILGVFSLLFLIYLCRKAWRWCAGNSAGAEKHEVVKIVLLGKTGVGKSATGNTILGRKAFKSKLKASEDRSQCEWQKGTVDGRELHVIDTPALFDTRATDTDIENQIQECNKLTSLGPHVFLAINQLGRFAPGELTEMREKIQRFFGEDSSKYTIALFTHGDKLEGGRIEEFVKENEALKEFVEQCGGGCHAFNNKDKKNNSQVRELVKKIDEMLERNGEHQRNEHQQEQETLLRGIELQTASN